MDDALANAENSGAMTALDYARKIRTHAVDAIARSEHRDCSDLDWADEVQFDVDAQTATCGVCGHMVDFVLSDYDLGDGARATATGGAVTVVEGNPFTSSVPVWQLGDSPTPAEMEQRIMDVVTRIEAGSSIEVDCITRRHIARQKYDDHFQAVVLTSEHGGADRRKAEATVACRDNGLAEALNRAVIDHEAVKALMHNLRATLSGLQTAARMVGLAYDNSGRTGP